MTQKRERGGKPKGRRIIELRHAKNWVTPADLARHAKREDGSRLDVKTVTEMEAGKRKDWSSLKAVAAALGVEVGEIAELPATNGPTNPDDKLFGGALTAVTPVSDFIGRGREQTDILAHLRGGGRVGISAIKAAGGVGKTQLAAKCTEQLRAAFDHVLWLRLDGMTAPKSPVAVLQEVIRYFRPTEKLPDAVAELLPLYLGELHGKRLGGVSSLEGEAPAEPEVAARQEPRPPELRHCRRLLIVLDNAKDAAQVKPLFDPAVPPTVAFLVTSRQKLLLTDAKTINLELLSEADAVTLLRGIVDGPQATRDDGAGFVGVRPSGRLSVGEDGLKPEPQPRGTAAEWKTVAAMCGCLPLALRVAGTFLREKPNWTLGRYAQAIRAEPLRHLDLGTDDENVGRVLSLSVRQLVEDNAEQAERFQALSVFPGDFAADAAAAVWALDPDDSFTELDDRIDRSLVEYDAPTDRYRLHDLMRPVARLAFEVGEIQNPSPADSCGVADLPRKGGGGKPAALFTSPLAGEVGSGAERTSREGGHHPLATGSDARLLLAEQRFARHYLTVLERTSELERSKDPGIVGALKLFDREQHNIRHGQAWAARRFEADSNDKFAAEMVARYPINGVYAADLRLSVREDKIPWLTAAAAAAKELGQKRWEGAALGNLGNAWRHLGDPRKAIGFYDQVLTFMRDIGDRRGEGNALGNLGNAWFDLGEPTKAIGFFEQVLAFMREIGNCRGEGNSLGNLGGAWAALGDHTKAIGFYEQRLKSANEIGDHRGEAETSWNMALSLVSLDRRAEAIPLTEASLRFYDEIGHPHAEMVRRAIEAWKAVAG